MADLRVALRRFLHETARITRAGGLTPQRYDLLAVIRGSSSSGLNITELANKLSLAPHSVSELVDRASELGLVRRVDDSDDRRVARVQLTPEGTRRLDAALVALRPEREALYALLGDVYQHAGRLQLPTRASGSRRASS